MLETVLPMLALLSAAGAAYYFGKKYAAPGSSQQAFRMEEAWNLMLRDVRRTPEDRLSTFGKALRQVPAERMEAIRAQLLRIEKEAGEARKPVRVLRSRIMDAASNSLFASHVLLLPDESRKELVREYGPSFSDEQMLHILVMEELKYTVLRSYAQFRHNDGSDKDWFNTYLRIGRQLMQARAGPGARQDRVSGMGAGEYMALLEQLKTKLLDAPRNAPVNEEAVMPEAGPTPKRDETHGSTGI